MSRLNSCMSILSPFTDPTAFALPRRRELPEERRSVSMKAIMAIPITTTRSPELFRIRSSVAISQMLNGGRIYNSPTASEPAPPENSNGRKWPSEWRAVQTKEDTAQLCSPIGIPCAIVRGYFSSKGPFLVERVDDRFDLRSPKRS